MCIQKNLEKSLLTRDFAKKREKINKKKKIIYGERRFSLLRS
jgi:hypothetical protein